MTCVWEMPPGISCECQDLLRGMLEKDPSKRLVMAAIEAHPWFLTGLPPNAFENTASAAGKCVRSELIGLIFGSVKAPLLF